MKLTFKKKAKVLVEGSTKYFLKGMTYSMAPSLGNKYLESGDAVLFTMEVLKPKKVKKVKKIKFVKTEKVEDNEQN